MGVYNEDSSKENDPLTLILACRNQQKAELAINNLRQRYPNALMKVKLEFLKVDLTNKHSICDAVQMYRDRYPKIDVFYANAGILLASGVDYLKGTIQMFTNTEAFFKTSGDILVQKVECVNNDGVGTVFMANVFGHYAMIKGLQDLFNEGSRIVWTGSATATSKYFSWKDMDGSRSNFPYESSKYATQLLSCALNSALKEQGVSSYYCEPGSVCTSIMDDQMSWFIQTFLMIPVMFIGSMFLDYVTFNSLNGAIALFFLSGLKSAESIKCDGETTLDENQKVPDPKFMYGSRCKYFSGDGRYVAKEPLEETLTSSECSRFLSEVELLRQKLLFSEQ
jgi:17beta-estradiol 17-dehydrogenase/3beta-hydroxysteroid 3-dehydrogenase